jgi:small GTP-binding protein
MSTSSSLTNESEVPLVTFKVITLCDYQVGRKCLLKRIASDTYEEGLQIGLEFVLKFVSDGMRRARLELWSAEPSDRFRKYSRLYYKNSHALLLIFDMTSLDSFKSLSHYIQDAFENCCSDCVKFLVGTKCDLVDQRQVPQEMIDEFCEARGLTYFETSAKNRINIDLLIEELSNQLFSEHNRRSSAPDVILPSDHYGSFSICYLL